MRVLVIEDDEKIQAFVSQGLQQEGHTVDVAMTGSEGLLAWKAQQYDAVVLDIMLPELDGLALLKHMRNQHDRTPVLVLSAKISTDDKVSGLISGADDYLVKPFAFAELSARLQALTRRINPPGSTTNILSVGDVQLDLLGRMAFRNNKRIELQPREFALLELLMRNPNQPLNKTFILEHIWDYRFDPQTNIVDVLICRLRTKLDGGHEKKVIQTMRGIGYVFRKID